jgi:hypothetical protein
MRVNRGIDIGTFRGINRWMEVCPEGMEREIDKGKDRGDA